MRLGLRGYHGLNGWQGGQVKDDRRWVVPGKVLLSFVAAKKVEW
jgi:hypothetical protein